MYLLWEFFEGYVLDGRNLGAHYCKIDAMYENEGRKFVSEALFRRVYECFQQRMLLKSGYRFCCEVCRDAPDILICDGTGVSISQTASHCEPMTGTDSNLPRVARDHSRNDRCFTNDPAQQAALTALQQQLQTLQPVDTVDTSALNNSSVHHLLPTLTHPGLPESLAHSAAQLLQCLASSSAVISYFPYVLFDFFDVVGEVEGDGAELLIEMEVSAPLLHAFIVCVAEFEQSVGSIPLEVQHLLAD
jgi:hypothetical protein